MIEKINNQVKLDSGNKENERKEKGKNVEIVLHIIRHGDRDLDGNLQDYGRERTKRNAIDYKAKNHDYDIVKAIGSDAGPTVTVDGKKMTRSLETAHIFAEEVSGGANYQTRARKILNYENIKSSRPYDHRKIYNSFIDEYIKNNFSDINNIEKFSDLNEEQKKEASSYADDKTVSYFMNLDTEDAKQMRKEIAGSFAYLIEHYSKMAKEKLHSNQKILYPAGSHVGLMEPLLTEAMVRKDENGKEIIGGKLEDIGGNFDPSEGFDVRIKTDEDGELEQYEVELSDSKRSLKSVYLDADKINELANFYRKLHEIN
jgi:hypothetical protein